MSPQLSVHYLLLQVGPVRDHSNAERKLVATGFTPLLVNLESITTKPNAGGGSEDCVAWTVEKAVYSFEHADKATADFSMDKGKYLQPLEGCLTWDVAQPLNKLHRKFLNTS